MRGNNMGYGGVMIKTWEVSSHSAFILGLALLCRMLSWQVVTTA